MAAAAARLALTRPAEDAERSAALLSACGAEVLLEPLLLVMPAAAAHVDITGVQGFLLTSANGARALADQLRQQSLQASFRLPALCVGDQTMRTARALGFSDARSANGDVSSLADLARRELDPARGALLHAAGTVQAGDLAALLAADGFTVQRSVLYETRQATALSADFLAAISAQQLDGILFYSPRTAVTFATLAGTATIGKDLGAVSAYCLSPAVANALAECGFAALRVAPQPTQDSLFDLLRQDFPALAPLASSTLEARQSRPTNHGDRSMSDRPTASAEASDAPASTPIPQDLTVTDAPEQAAEDGNAGKKGSGKAIGVGLAAVVVAGLAGYASLPWWVSSLPPSVRPMAQKLLPPVEKDATAAEVRALRKALTAVQGDLGALQGRVGTLEAARAAAPVAAPLAAAPAETPAVPATASAAEAGVSDLEQRLAALDGKVQGAHSAMVTTIDELKTALSELKASRAPASAVTSLSERVNGLEAAVAQAVSRQDRALAFLLAVGQLRAAVEGGRPFADELKTVIALAPEDADAQSQTAGFASAAARGIPTLTALQQSFAPLGSQVVRASALPDESADWWSRTVDRLLTVVVIRRIDGEAVGNGPAAVVSRAEALLNTGALAEAVAELDVLTDAPAQAAAAWMTQAKTRLAADAALNELTSSALAAVSAAQTAPQPAPASATPNKEG